MTSRNFKQSMVNQDQEITFEVVKVSGSWVFPAASSIVEATRGKNMYLRLTDDEKSEIFRLDSVKDGDNIGETVFGFVGNGGMDIVKLTATTDGTGTTTGSWEYEPGKGPAGLVKDSLDSKAPANDGQSPHDITKFLRADGSWQMPPKSLQYWSGGGSYIKGVYIGTCNLKDGTVSWITGNMSLSNYYDSNPNTAKGKGIALGVFYLWAVRKGNDITASCRLYSMNSRHTNDNLILVYKKDTSDDTTYKVRFYVCLGQGTPGGGTSTSQRPFGLGINYLENHNADIPSSLTGITNDIQYDDDYYSIFKMPYLVQAVDGAGSSIEPAYVNSNGQVGRCNGTVVKIIPKSDTSYTLPSSTNAVAVGQIVSIYNSGSGTLTVNGIDGTTQTIASKRFRMYYRFGSGASDYCKYGDS